MDNEPVEKNIESLVRKAGAAEKASDAMQFSQAALNAANALHGLMHIRKQPRPLTNK